MQTKICNKTVNIVQISKNAPKGFPTAAGKLSP